MGEALTHNFSLPAWALKLTGLCLIPAICLSAPLYLEPKIEAEDLYNVFEMNSTHILWVTMAWSNHVVTRILN